MNELIGTMFLLHMGGECTLFQPESAQVSCCMHQHRCHITQKIES